MPEEAFIGVQELKDLYGEGATMDASIIAISFVQTPLLTPTHESAASNRRGHDGKGEEKVCDSSQVHSSRFSEMGVFWDWLSIYQKDKDGNRTPFEQEGFRYALHETMDLWYAHQGTTVYMLTQLPEGSTRKVGYVDSGWTTYERCSAEQMFYLFEAKWKLVLDLGAEGDCLHEDAQLAGWPGRL